MFHIKPTVTQEATDWAVEILDASYKAADIPKVVEDNCAHLAIAEKSKLLDLLQEFMQFFYGTLGGWKWVLQGLNYGRIIHLMLAGLTGFQNTIKASSERKLTY